MLCIVSNLYSINNLKQKKSSILFFIQDTLPPLHTIKGKDIDKISSTFETKTITISLKNGSIYTYHQLDWDYEDHFPSITKTIVDAIRNLQMTFTKVEQPPIFPGGDEAFKKYVHEFCQNHKDEIGDHGHAEFVVQFIVHLHGQIDDLQVILNKNGSELSSLAKEAIKNGPAWVPAVQNGRQVVSYVKQVIEIGL